MQTFPAPVRPAARWVRWLFLLPLPLVFVGLFLVAAPKQVVYALDADGLTAQAWVGPWDQGRTVPRAGLHAERVRLSGGVRTFGTHTSGYCQGQYRYDGIPSAWVAGDCRADAVRVDTPEGAWVLTPTDPDRFVAAIADPAATYAETLPSAPRSIAEILLVLILGTVAPGTLLLVIRLLGRSLVYRLEGTTLVVPAHFGTVRVRLAGARVTRGPLVRPMRLAGSAVPGVLFLGLFRSEGKNLHVAATNLGEGFLIDGDRRVFVNPEDTAGFAAAIVAAGAN